MRETLQDGRANTMIPIIIMGAAGRDFHNFNMLYRDNPDVRVVAFTAAQIPQIADRSYPPELAGHLYPEGIPIHPEEKLSTLISDYQVAQVIFSYSDISYRELMHKAALVSASGADFLLIGASRTMLDARCKVVSVCAVRTGCGKSQTTRKICRLLRSAGHRVVVVRHPMPYGDLSRQAVQRFAEFEDFAKQECTIEEREEYEPLVEEGVVVFAGIDYRRILRAAEEEGDVIVWDGGNNDTPFFRPDLHIVLFDPHRAGHERLYYPGETNMLLADVAIINKVDSAEKQAITRLRQVIAAQAPNASVVLAESPVVVEAAEQIAGRRVLVVEDGPSLTHGELNFGAGFIAARRHGAAQLVDPRPQSKGSIAETFRRYPHIGPVLPAMGYGAAQIKELEETIAATDCDLVLFATPIHLPRLLKISQPSLRVRYEYRDHGTPTLADVLRQRLPELLS
jgi:predicted GTPase